MQLVQPLTYATAPKDGPTLGRASDPVDPGVPFEGVLSAAIDAETTSVETAQTATSAKDDTNAAAEKEQASNKLDQGGRDGDAATDAAQPRAVVSTVDVDPAVTAVEAPTAEQNRRRGDGAGTADASRIEKTASETGTTTGTEKARRVSPISAMVEGLSATNTASGQKAGNSPSAEQMIPADQKLNPINSSMVFERDKLPGVHSVAARGQGLGDPTLPTAKDNKNAPSPTAIQAPGRSLPTAQTIPHTAPPPPSSNHASNPAALDGMLGTPTTSQNRVKYTDSVSQTTALPSTTTDAAKVELRALGSTFAPKNSTPDGSFQTQPKAVTPDLQTADINRSAANYSSIENRVHSTPLVARESSSVVIPATTLKPLNDQISTLVQNALEFEPTVKTDLATWDLRPHMSQTGTTALPVQLQRAEMPPHVSHALAEALRKSPDKPIELTLSPAELGRVRMVMSTQDAGIIVTISADRGDTLDLMRRNIDDLGKTLSELGYSDVSFTFEQDHNSSATPNEGAADDISDHASTTEDSPTQVAMTSAPLTSPYTGTTGIDMRL